MAAIDFNRSQELTDGQQNNPPGQLYLVEGASSREQPNDLNLTLSTPVTDKDVYDMAALDVRSFRDVYGANLDAGRYLRSVFQRRLEITGSDWTQLVRDSGGALLGFLMCCPTDKKPEDFTSWEETTNNGTLEGVCNPKGPNVYVVSLTTTPNRFGGETYQGMLYANLIGKFIAENMELAFFESRMPMFRRWARKQTRSKNLKLGSLGDDDLQKLANEYAKLTSEDEDGNIALQDPVLREFARLGCKFLDPVPNAYEDPMSLNFGCVGIFDNPLPRLMRSIPGIPRAAGTIIRAASKHPSLVDRFI